MGIRSETELYAPVKAFLEQRGYEVKSEIHSCDVVAVKEGEEQPVVVELKKSFGLPLIYQGIDRLAVTDRVYLAVEGDDRLGRGRRNKWKRAETLCRMLGLGLIAVKFYRTRPPAVHLLCEPDPQEAAARRTGRRTKRLLDEFRSRRADFNTGGSTQTKLVTAYREKALECAWWLREKGPLSPKMLRELTENAHAGRIVYDNVYGWFVRESRGRYALSEAGRQALDEYRSVVERLFHPLNA